MSRVSMAGAIPILLQKPNNLWLFQFPLHGGGGKRIVLRHILENFKHVPDLTLTYEESKSWIFQDSTFQILISGKASAIAKLFDAIDKQVIEH